MNLFIKYNLNISSYELLIRSCFLLLFFFLSFKNLYAQTPGCTDSFAKNYDKLATYNNGSCKYKNVNYKATKLVLLPDNIIESSGLLLNNKVVLTHNDGGGKPCLYSINYMTGEVVQTIQISNAKNIDWESLAEDSSYYYIGDFGNNNGNRKDLKIYKVRKIMNTQSGILKAEAEIINFHYPDQYSFQSRPYNHDFDCEAIISYKDSLYLFTKNWKSKNTKLYSLPKTPGIHIATLLDSFDVNGLITGADIKNGIGIVLLGYNNFKPFIWLLYDYQANSFFKANKKRVNYRCLLGTQLEGITFLNPVTLLYSTEKTPLVKSCLYKSNIYDLINEIHPEITGSDGFYPYFEAKYNVENSSIKIISNQLEKRKVELKITDESGDLVEYKKIKVKKNRCSTSNISLSGKLSQSYFLTIINGNYTTQFNIFAD